MKTSVTILNKLSRYDSDDTLDKWFKFSIDNLEYSRKSVTYTMGSTISMGEKFIILFPFSDKFLPYKEWKKLEDKTGYYTISLGDYIVVGEDVPQEVNSANIIQIKQLYEPNVCEVKAIIEAKNNGLANYRFRVEGV